MKFKMKNQARFNQALVVFTRFMALVMLGVTVALWLLPVWREAWLYNLSGLATDTPITLTPLVIASGLLLSTIHVGILSYALWVMAAMFQLLGTGQWQTLKLSYLLKQFARAIVLFALLSPLISSLLASLLTFYNLAGQKVLQMAVSGNEIILGLLGVLLLMLAHVLHEAIVIADDNRQII
jgi:hypothetical protein